MRDFLDQTLRAEFPATANLASLEYVSVEQLDAERFGIVVRLIIWEDDGNGKQSIRDVKEQEIRLQLDAIDQASPDRVGEMVRALVDVASRALASAEIDYLMPHDIMDFSPLKLSRAQTKVDFMRALAKPSRLGKYLPEDQRS
ncbi:MAG TPA: hypothetical protein VIV11_32120 [Kofleriaceae bacterium]